MLCVNKNVKLRNFDFINLRSLKSVFLYVNIKFGSKLLSSVKVNSDSGYTIYIILSLLVIT